MSSLHLLFALLLLSPLLTEAIMGNCGVVCAAGRCSSAPGDSCECVDGMCFCNSCTGSIVYPDPSCQDLHAPGRVSDCPRLQYLCSNPLYKKVMQVQCRRTCKFCN
ncbi:hypothetical protein L596_028049 [Steinernema carpocapsae]|uniref:ShKT domain-containing protein n=1 Tax=Steinernema carpocapsae TaxID=34508 RepID=A0A4V6XVM9_STECR|nr:hypothetical protein L596_028049 [Steinernema carpocapsae]